MQYKATCFDYNLVIFRPILTVVLPDTMHTLGSHSVYIRGICLIETFVYSAHVNTMGSQIVHSIW